MNEPIVLGRIDESFHQVAAAIVEEVLLRLGHGVQVREGPHPQMYPLIEQGELHLFADSWLPGGHGTYWEQIRDQVVEVAALFDGARFFWAVPGYVPADLASALPDLARPEVVARMATLVVQGTTPGAGLTMRSQQLVHDYGLDEAGWSHEIGDLQAIIRTVDERIAAGDWFVTPMWQPQYLNDVHDLRPLDDPRGVFPPPDRASLIAHRDTYDRSPGAPATCWPGSATPSPTSTRWTARSTSAASTRSPRRATGWTTTPTRCGPGWTEEDEMAHVEWFAANGVYDPPSHAQGVKVTGAQTILFIAGQVAFDEHGGPAHGRDFAAQAREVFRALQAQVEAGGATLRDVVKLTTYLTDIRYREELNPIREEFFGPKLPAHTQVAIAALGRPEWLIEVEAIAVL